MEKENKKREKKRIFFMKGIIIIVRVMKKVEDVDEINLLLWRREEKMED